jgi:hypothetical protein
LESAESFLSMLGGRGMVRIVDDMIDFNVNKKTGGIGRR